MTITSRPTTPGALARELSKLGLHAHLYGDQWVLISPHTRTKVCADKGRCLKLLTPALDSPDPTGYDGIATVDGAGGPLSAPAPRRRSPP